MFVKNCWYVAAASEDITHGHLFARRILSEPVILYRTIDNDLVALLDRCPHRLMPLSLGEVNERDEVVCPYHGLTFAPSGKCVRVPGQESTSNISVRRFPLEEKWGYVWIWMGDLNKSDPDLIVDASWLGRPDWKKTVLYRRVKANYLLVNANLSDLLHVATLHRPSGGGNDDMSFANMTVVPSEFGYHQVRITKNIPAPPAYARLANTTESIDRWHIADFVGPSFYKVHTGVAVSGSGGPESKLPTGNGRWSIAPHHFITPETETSTHYYEAVAHEWEPTEQTTEFLNTVIDEDVWALEHQQESMEAAGDVVHATIRSDGPMLIMYRIVKRLLAAEAKEIAG